MRDRLIELINDAEYESYKYELAQKFYPFGECKSRSEFVADYLLASGVIVPPCKVGDTVYPLNADRRFRAIIEKIEINANGLLFGWVQYDVGVDCTECWDEDLFTIDDIGKTVFLDEIEYLIALKKDGAV